MSKIFILSILLIVVFLGQASAARLTLEFEIKLIGEPENLIGVSLEEIYVTDSEVGEPYFVEEENNLIVEISDEKGSILESKPAGFDFYLGDSPLISPITNVNMEFEYSEKVNFIKVFFKEKEVFNENIGDLLCNSDDKCDDFENYLSCKEDCSMNSKDGICNSHVNDDICDLDCFLDIEKGGDCSESYATLKVFSDGAVNFYCEKDSIIYNQKAKGTCKENFECESNICSGESCVDLETLGDDARAVVKIACKLIHLFNQEEYEQCLYRFTVPSGTTGKAIGITGAIIKAFSVFGGMGENSISGYVTLNEIDVDTFVRNAYLFFLKREGEPSGIDYWKGQAAQGVTRTEILFRFWNSPEKQAQLAGLGKEDFVKAMYRDILGREGEASGVAYWVDQMNRGVKGEDIARGFIKSGEFENRFVNFVQQPTPTPTPIPAPSQNCEITKWGTRFTGTHDRVGLSTGDSRFLCFSARFYECGWEVKDESFALEVLNGQQVGSWACELATGRWLTPCAETNWEFKDSACRPENKLTRSWAKVGACIGGIQHANEEVVCDFQAPSCASFLYSEWGECLPSGIRTRTIIGSSPQGCAGGSPVLSESCTYVPPKAKCIEGDWVSDVSPAECPDSGIQIISWQKKPGVDCENGVQYPSSEEMQCSVGLCAGCNVPRWMAGTDTFVSEELEKGKSCISYGTRFNAVDSIVNVKERIPLKELEGDYSLDVKSDTEAELILFGQRWIVRTPETESLQKYTLVTGKSYDIVQPGWRPIIKTKVEGIFYKPTL